MATTNYVRQRDDGTTEEVNLKRIDDLFRKYGVKTEGTWTALVDILTDLQHYAAQHQIDPQYFDNCLDRARAHYYIESVEAQK